MSYQTTEALIDRKLKPWLKRGVINHNQFATIIIHCERYGFWSALGYATRLRYKNKPSGKRYEYKWIRLAKDDCKLFEYTTSGRMMSSKKRFRSWRNIYFDTNGESKVEQIRKEYPDWEIFHMKHGCYNIGLRREVPPEGLQ